MARARKPLTKVVVVRRVIVALIVIVLACPYWIGMDGYSLFSTASVEAVYMMRASVGEDGARTSLVSDPSVSRWMYQVDETDWNTTLIVQVLGRPPISEADRLFGAPVRLTNQMRVTAVSRSPLLSNSGSAHLASLWETFATRLHALERTHEGDNRSDRGRYGIEASTTPQQIAVALRSELGRNPGTFGAVMSSAWNWSPTFPAKVVHWPAVRWVGLRLLLLVVCHFAALYAIALVWRLRCADWRNSPWCPRCRYSLDSNMPQCPECGTAIRWAERK